jgi:uncharacterized membrane-anchored protein YhcB (DUF1043 family)
MNIKDFLTGLVIGLIIAALIWRYYSGRLYNLQQNFGKLWDENFLLLKKQETLLIELDNVAELLPKLQPTKPTTNWNNPPEGISGGGK